VYSAQLSGIEGAGEAKTSSQISVLAVSNQSYAVTSQKNILTESQEVMVTAGYIENGTNNFTSTGSRLVN